MTRTRAEVRRWRKRRHRENRIRREHNIAKATGNYGSGARVQGETPEVLKSLREQIRDLLLFTKWRRPR